MNPREPQQHRTIITTEAPPTRITVETAETTERRLAPFQPVPVPAPRP